MLLWEKISHRTKCNCYEMAKVGIRSSFICPLLVSQQKPEGGRNGGAAQCAFDAPNKVEVHN